MVSWGVCGSGQEEGAGGVAGLGMQNPTENANERFSKILPFLSVNLFHGKKDFNALNYYFFKL